MTPQEANDQKREGIQAELVEARLLWRSCVHREDRRGEAFAMKKLDDALDRLHALFPNR